MTTEEAKQNISQPFKWTLCIKWDVIKEVSDDGFIIGEFLTAPIEDCRLKQEIPDGLKKYHDTTRKGFAEETTA